MLKILTDNHPLLKTPSESVVEINDEVRELIRKMAVTMAIAQGIGLSAVQVGVAKRILLIDTRYLPHINPKGKFFAMINPEILHEEGTCRMREGCLSFPRKYLTIDRSKKVKVKYITSSGTTEIVELDDLEARVFLHEYDHLEGKVFTDVAKS